MSRLSDKISGITYTIVRRFLASYYEGDLYKQYSDANFSEKTRQITKKLKYCGKNLFINYPVVINEPEGVSIGDDVALGAFATIWGGGGVEIGDRTMIGAGTVITSRFHDMRDPQPRFTLTAGRVKIGKDVMIAVGAVVLPGVEIKDGAVIGANAVVTKDVAENELVLGIPAKPVRNRFEKKK